jgi:ribosome-associated toxin RatA of RatAB toxin-antitoxin module
MANQTQSSIVINAAPAKIMDVIADLTAYPEWSEGVRRVEILTEFEDGRPGDAQFRLESGPIKDTYSLAYTWEEDKEVSWTLTEGQMLKSMEGSYRLTDNGDGTTTVDYTLAVDINIPMIGLIKRKAEKVIVDTALRGLKSRVEQDS